MGGLDETAAEQRLWRYYDRLRERFLDACGLGEGSRTWPQTLLLAPDLFVLMVRLFLDRELPKASRQLIGGALLYFLIPVDLMPEMVLGVGGFLDDVVVAAAVLSHVFSDPVAPFAERHWSGSSDLRRVLSDTIATARSLLGQDLYRRLARVLRGRGVNLP